MVVNIPISLGELVDKISILKIKEKNIDDNQKKEQVKKELLLLETSLENLQHDKLLIQKYLNELIVINSKLWKIEDNLRKCERNKNFNKEFVELARSVYLTNDKRYKIKLEINKKFKSKIVEVKSYEKY